MPSTIEEEEEDPKVSARGQLNNAITQIGPGPYQLIVLLLGGGVYMAEGSLLLMLSVIAKSLIIRWKLSAYFAGAMVSIIFCGLLIGTILGGSMADRYGRRMPILVTYAGMTLFLGCSVMSPDILYLFTAKFMLGLSLGFGVPAANAMVCESCPSSHRSNVYSMTMVMFSLGQMFSACVLWVMSPEIDVFELKWRAMLTITAMLPLVLGTLSYFFLLESSHWLLAQGRLSEAREVVMAMSQYKNLPPEFMEILTDDIQTPVPSPLALPRLPLQERGVTAPEPSYLQIARKAVSEDVARLKQLFSTRFLRTTVLMSFISFTSNFCYYGMIYGLPETLKKESDHGHAAWSPAAGVFLSAVFEIPGVFIAILLGTTVGRKMNMTISFGCTAVALAALSWIFYYGDNTNLGLAAVFCVKMFIASVFIVVYLYLLECYPTKFRATGLAFCMVIGRTGAFACPFLFDGLNILGFHHVTFFIIMGVLVSVAAILSSQLPYETKDSQLMADDVPVAVPGERTIHDALMDSKMYDYQISKCRQREDSASPELGVRNNGVTRMSSAPSDPMNPESPKNRKREMKSSKEPVQRMTSAPEV